METPLQLQRYVFGECAGMPVSQHLVMDASASSLHESQSVARCALSIELQTHVLSDSFIIGLGLRWRSTSRKKKKKQVR